MVSDLYHTTFTQWLPENLPICRERLQEREKKGMIAKVKLKKYSMIFIQIDKE